MKHDTGGRWLEQLPLAGDRPWLGVAAMLAMVVAAIALRFLVDPMLPPGFPYLTFFPVVILSSFLFGARIGAGAAVLCGLAAWFWFIPPFSSFAIGPQTGVALGFYAFVVATDVALVHWMQRANRNLAHQRRVSVALADTRELLFGELQHRVSNNLQVAAGLLSVQKRSVADPAARAALDEAVRRLALIGRISRQLYDAAGGVRDMRGFLEPLCADVVDASGRPGIRCTVEVADEAQLRPDAAIPLALIVGEAIANAIEHGFRDRDTGAIAVQLTRQPADRLQIDIIDDGHGLPDGFRADASDSLGLRIATMLAQQLDGSFTMIAGPRTTARLLLPA